MDTYINYQNDISIEEISAMITDMEELFYHIERFNELLAEKQKQRHPSFGMFLRALTINNCNAISASLKIKSILDKAIMDYLENTDEGGNG